MVFLESTVPAMSSPVSLRSVRFNAVKTGVFDVLVLQPLADSSAQNKYKVRSSLSINVEQIGVQNKDIFITMQVDDRVGVSCTSAGICPIGYKIDGNYNTYRATTGIGGPNIEDELQFSSGGNITFGIQFCFNEGEAEIKETSTTASPTTQQVTTPIATTTTTPIATTTTTQIATTTTTQIATTTMPSSGTDIGLVLNVACNVNVTVKENM